MFKFCLKPFFFPPLITISRRFCTLIWESMFVCGLVQTRMVEIIYPRLFFSLFEWLTPHIKIRALLLVAITWQSHFSLFLFIYLFIYLFIFSCFLVPWNIISRRLLFSSFFPFVLLPLQIQSSNLHAVRLTCMTISRLLKRHRLSRLSEAISREQRELKNLAAEKYE